MMLLQSLIYEPAEEALSIRKNGKIEKMDHVLYFEKGASLSTNTYLNAFSVGKWNRYCKIEMINLRLKGLGKFVLKVIYAHIDYMDRLSELILHDIQIELLPQQEYVFTLPDYPDGVIYYELMACSDESKIISAEYIGDVKKTNPVRLALNICTYRRETFLLKNLALINRLFILNEVSELYDKLEVFVTDNGNTLDISRLETSHIHIVYNPNVGGTGGFTRGLIEIGRVKEEKNISHVVFMDDDIEIIPESLVRTYHFLSALKEEYRDSFIAGAMLNLDKRFLQHENGALWNQGRCLFHNRGVDLQIFSNVVRNECMACVDYAAWWYCCIPVSIVRKDNLPIPIFIHEDDVEYSLRNAKSVITLNGIAVRHPVADNKRISSNHYYNLRNLLIVNARYCPSFGKKQLRKKMLGELLMPLLRYRYEDMKISYLALMDFCKGPDWLLNLDSVEYHKQILRMGYQFTDVSKELESVECGKQRVYTEYNSIKDIYRIEKANGRKWKFIGQLLSLNGWLLAGNHEMKAFLMSVHPFDLYREKKVLLYDDISKHGIIVSRQFYRIFEFIWLYLKSLVLIETRYEKSKELYNKKYGQLTGIEAWEKILFLEE